MFIAKRALSAVELHAHVKWPYAWALLLVFVGFVLRYTLFPTDTDSAFITFYPVTILSFYFLGLRPGLFTVILSGILSNYFFLAPHFAFSHNKVADLSMLFFLLTNMLVAYLTYQQQIHAQRFHVLLEDQTDLISRFRANGTMLYANKAYLKFFGIKKENVAALQWQTLVFEEDLPAVNERIKQISIDNPVVVIENRVYDYIHNVRWFQFINHGIFNAEDKLIEIQSVGRDTTSLKEQEEAFNFMAHHDGLTKLPNRVLFNDRLNQVIAYAKRNNKIVTVCFLDLDGFKPINDTYGHNAGDEVLVEISNRMKKCLRGGDTVSRMGGDEFMILINDNASHEGGPQVLNRVLSTISKPIKLSNGALVSVTASMGVSEFPKDAEKPEQLIRMADEKMYQAKASGRNKIEYR